MDENNNLKWGVIFSYLNTAMGFVVAILYTPFLLQSLGQQQYGLYNMGQAAVSYLSLTEFGFGNAVVRYASKYRAEGNKEKTAALYGMFTYLYLAIAVIVFVIGMVLVMFSDRFYSVSTGAEGYRQLRIIMTIMVINMTYTFSTTVFSAIINSYEKFTFSKVTELIYTILKPISMIPLLIFGYKAVALSVVTLILTVALHTGNIIYVRKKLKVQICMNTKNMDFSILKEILGYSFFIFLGTIVSQLNNNTDNIILGIISGEAAVAVYSIGYTLNTYIQQIPGIISGVFFPRVTMRITKGATMEEMTNLMTRIGRIQFFLSLLVCSGFLIFGKCFITLWAGESYHTAYWIILVLIIPAMIPNIQSIGVQILQAMNKHQFRAVLYVVCAVLNVAFSIPAGLQFGPLGCAACTGLTTLLTCGFVMNWYYRKKINLDMAYFWKNILSIFVRALPVLTVGYCAGAIFFSPSNWITLGIAIIAYTVIYAIYIYCVCMNESEKLIIAGMLARTETVKRR